MSRTGITMRRAFFFPHALRPKVYPGRVEFEVVGTLLSKAGARTGQAVVLADGYVKNSLGWNQDPCIFSEPFGALHSFCRINRTGGNCRVRELSGNLRPSLPECVSTGDVVIYGKYDPPGKFGPTQSIWVDTVLVVDHVRSWRTDRRPSQRPCNSGGRCRKRRFVIADPHEFGRDNVSTTADAYRYNLSDAEPGGSHCCTSLRDYRVIVGANRPTVSAFQTLETSFVPLSSGGAPATVTARDLVPADWKSLTRFIDGSARSGAGGPFGGWIAELDFATATRLCEAIIVKSGGVVAVPPLKPVQSGTRRSRQRKGGFHNVREH